MELLNVPGRCKNVSVVGHLHSGKTSLLDLLISHCQVDELPIPRTNIKNSYYHNCRLPRYLDSLKLEQERGISLRSKPISLLLNHSRTQTSFPINLLDCPGHSNFREDVGVGISILSDSVLLIVDALEGVQVETEEILKSCMNLNKKVILIITKIERLWLELKMPPMDSYYKLKNIIDKLNTIIGSCYFAPEIGNVIFSSALGGYAFSLLSFVQSKYPKLKDPVSFSRKLWGDYHYEEESKRVIRSKTGGKRTFVTFILEPLYKVYTQSLSATNSSTLQKFIDEELTGKGGESLNAKDLLKLNPRPLLKKVLNKFFNSNPIMGLIDTICEIETKESLDTPFNDQLLMSICKVYPPASLITSKSQMMLDQPRVLCRLWNGSIRSDQRIFIRSGNFNDDQDEEIIEVKVGKIFIPCTRYEIPVKEGMTTKAPWVLLTGIPLDKIIKYGIITDEPGNLSIPPSRFIPNTASHFRVSIEPIVPSELPKMLQVLRLLGLIYPSLITKVEDSGEHVILTPGELYADCVLNDLRSFSNGIELRISDPSASLSETVSEISRLKCFIDTGNERLRITMIAEPMEKGLSEFLESSFTLPGERELIDKYGWDLISCRSILSKSQIGGNLLIDDTFGDCKELTKHCLPSIIQGFNWAVREGPLCEEPIRGVKFRLISLVTLGDVNSLSVLSPAQIVPATRKCCYAAFLTASPRLLEPIQNVAILTPGGSDTSQIIYNLLARRRGHIISDTPVPGTPLYLIRTLLPLLDSPGFETDLRSMTGGAALPTFTFSHWQPIPGDPLDKSIPLALLEPAPAPALARDCLLKMRRRRGIGEDVKLEKYFDPEILNLL